jgi:hypothetical protein
MITAAWNARGFYVLTALLKGIKFKANYSSREIPEHISKRLGTQRTGRT